MKIEDKKALYRLLSEYMSDLLELDKENIKRKKRPERTRMAGRKQSHIRSKSAVQSCTMHL